MSARIRILFVLILFTLTSCEDWFEVGVQNEIVKEEFWQNKEDVESAVVAVYVAARKPIFEYFHWGELRADAFSPTLFSSNSLQEVFGGRNGPNNSISKWSNLYSTINLANIVLENINSAKELDPSFTDQLANEYIGQMVFLRSLSYFYLTRAFADVPVPSGSFESDEANFFLPKEKQSVILENLEKDLEGVVDFLPNNYQSDELTKGFATRWAARALLADVYLWNGNYGKALGICNEILNSKRFTLMGRNSWFNIFSEGNTNESIFEFQFDATRAGDQTNSLHEYVSPNVHFGNVGDNIVTPHIMSFFDPLLDNRFSQGFLVDELTLWKYIGDQPADVNTQDERANNDANWILYRLAEVYLMKAESEIGLDQFNDALGSINRIRIRAGVPTFTMADTATLNKEVMYRLLLDERAREFVGEGKRWFDLVRVASKDDFKYKDLLIDPVLETRFSGFVPVLRSNLEDPRFWYLPIHQSEIDRNINLSQNTWYEERFGR